MFHEVQFPTDISYGSQGGPGFLTQIIQTQGGAEERTARWSSPRRKYNVAYGIQTHENLADARDFYIARKGAFAGFRYKDFYDCCTGGKGLDESLSGGVAPDDEDENIGTGDGTTTQFQLIKTYSSGPTTFTQNITKPVAGTVVVAIDGVAQTEGADFTVDTTTGLITFASAPALGAVITAGCKYDIPVRFQESADELFNLSIDNFGGGAATSIELIEIIDESQQPCEYFYGGSAEVILSGADFQLSLNTGKFIVVQPNTAGDALRLPLKSQVPAGGIIFIVANTSLVNTFDIDDGDTLNLVKTVPVDSIVAVVLQKGSTDQWFVF